MSDVVPTFERMAAVTVPEDVLVRRPPRVLGARQNPKTSTVHTQSIFCYLPGYPPTSTPHPDRRGPRGKRPVERGPGRHEAATKLWNAVRASVSSPTSDGLPALGRLERSIVTIGGRVRILPRELLFNADEFDAASWGEVTEQLAVQLKFLNGRQLR
ncbi:hypothetical protein JCM13580A_24590 [Streptomyces drozdowiczii]|uniref:hypothetical protein n=1 Tax=Streptomyces drozdowiczii TaxID=202862 RepID=UPI0031F09A8D